MSKQKVAIISYSDLKCDPRVKRQINFFKPFFEITTIGFQYSDIEGVSHLDVSSPHNKWKFILPLPKLLLGLFDSYHSSKLNELFFIAHIIAL
jgi:hypothetical protein